MEPEAFALLIDRLERIEKQNDVQTTLLQGHVKEDNETRAIVDQHSTYFTWMKRAGGVIVTAVLAKLGLS